MKDVRRILGREGLGRRRRGGTRVFLPCLLFVVSRPGLVLGRTVVRCLRDERVRLNFDVVCAASRRSGLPRGVEAVYVLSGSRRTRLLLSRKREGGLQFRIRRARKVPLRGVTETLDPLVRRRKVASRMPSGLAFFRVCKMSGARRLRIRGQ